MEYTRTYDGVMIIVHACKFIFYVDLLEMDFKSPFHCALTLLLSPTLTYSTIFICNIPHQRVYEYSFSSSNKISTPCTEP